MNSPIDPNDLIINPNLLGKGFNGIPDSSKMHLFVELTAQRREGSVLVSSGVGTSSNTTLNSQDNDISINMMGFDQDTGTYSTRWSRNYNDNKTNFEGFGITDININVNSSYVPTVDIEFVDIRGSSLFTFGSKSPYSVLFSFPPPIFTLTVKGYYGLALTYTLHFVRQTTKFDATTGNFYISANFVGQKYAPLTDILFKYIDVVPLMNDSNTDTGINLDPAQPPRNTRELIIKAQKLYDDLETFKAESTLAKEADQFRTDFYTAKSLLNAINSAHNQMDTEFQTLTDLYVKNNSVQSAALFEKTTLDNYDRIIREVSQSSLTTPTTKLVLATSYTNRSQNGAGDAIINRILSGLTYTKKILIEEAGNVNGEIKDNDIKPPSYVNGSGFVTMDITDFYLKIYKDIQTKQKQFETKQDAYRSEVNKISTNSLGKVPTIKFIFEILCNDVDKFFAKLKDVGSLAERHHAKYFSKIVDNNLSTKQKISPFPLVIKRGSVVTDKNSGGSSAALNRDERAYPAEVFIDIETFPEVSFVESFITTYLNIVKSEEILNLKNNVDEQGNNKWMPINPLDSAVNGRISAISPYFSKFNPIPDLISEIVNRFYILSQFSYDKFFYHDDSNIVTKFFGVDSKQLDLLTFIAKGEAANIVNSITDSNLLNALSVQANNWKQGIALNNNNFYDVLKNNVSVKSPTGVGVNIYNSFELPGHPGDDFINDDPNDATSFLLLNGQIVTKDRKSKHYKGFELLNNKPALRTPNNDGSDTGEENAVDKFLDRYSTDTFRNFLFAGDKAAFSDFTKQNIMYVKDNQAEDEGEFDSDFIKDQSWFTSSISLFGSSARQADQNASVILSKFLSRGDSFFKTILSDSDPNITNNVKAYIFATLFGRAIPYFDLDEKINQKFAFPAVVQIPRFAHLHMGALSYFYTTGATTTGMAEITYFNNKYGSTFHINTTYQTSNGDDATQQIQLISHTDYLELINFFTGFTSNTGEDGWLVMQNKFLALINEVGALHKTNVDDKFDEYQKRLSGSELQSSETDFSKIITGKLTNSLYLLNYSQTTFYPTDSPVDDFVPLAAKNADANSKKANDTYFTLFFTETIKLIEERKNALRKIEDKFQSSIEDNDIKTQCYYSFKNISDRWILGFGQQGIMGKNTPLIDDFKFIDRAGNDIGEKVVIDFRPIIEMSKDFDVSIFTVMSRILSLNGFEFFPLQNFIDFSNTDGNAKFDDVFKISSSQKVQIKSSPKFVCMYIGGTSSQLDDGAGDFDDDGIQKLESVVDFAQSPTQAFKVSFGKQNQSIFTNIELSTNEHKETNESLAILSEIAQDQSTSSPVPKGQNLFSTYEQRSYTCKVEMLGDIMIQPTQYFVLENVPMFRGAYLILQVQHGITANHMKTAFTGVRIRKVPQPFVRDFATATGVKGGSADAHLTDPNVVGNAFNNNAVNGVNPITNDQTSRLLSPR